MYNNYHAYKVMGGRGEGGGGRGEGGGDRVCVPLGDFCCCVLKLPFLVLGMMLISIRTVYSVNLPYLDAFLYFTRQYPLFSSF